MPTPLVSIHCLVYNHAPYLKDCLEGFVMQKTDFPFEAIVHDDASTDDSAAIILEYAEKYPDIIKPIIERENQYSKKDGSLGRIMSAHMRGKYVAMCEGDDYWTSPNKLQSQVDFMENHPEFSLTCTDAVVRGVDGDLNWIRYSKDCEIPMKDLIEKRGAWIYTASMLYRNDLMSDYPDYAKRCHVGDFPLAIHLGIKGKVYFFADKMVTYRYMTPGSWSATTRIDESFYPKWLSEIRMLQGFNETSARKYESHFHRTMGKFAIFFLRHVPSMKKKVLEVLPDFPKWLDLSDKIKWWRLLLGLNGIKRRLSRVFKKSAFKKR